MLTRLRFRRDFRLIVRSLSDKPDDGKVPEIKPKEPAAPKKSSENATEKIQQLLKSMLAEPKISEKEYAEKFATAPDPRRKKEVKKIENIEESLTKAAIDVAQAIGGDVKQTEAELLSRVLGKINQTSTSLSDLLIGMKVDRKTDSEDKPRETRGQFVKRHMERQGSRPQSGDARWQTSGAQETRYSQRTGRAAEEMRYTPRKGRAAEEGKGEPRRREISSAAPMSVNVFSAEPLGIFKAGEQNYGTELAMWESLKQRELTLATAQPPTNYFEKMIQWTEQGKVWKFPIDNEQGLEEEKQVHFSEHIFLDSHLEGWCPKKGPIRHFMELVCVGLSKNAFYTVQEKKDHIMWYKEFFESKQDLLNEVGVWEKTKSSSEAEASP